MKEVLNAAGEGDSLSMGKRSCVILHEKLGGVVTTKPMEGSNAGDQEPSKQHPGPSQKCLLCNLYTNHYLIQMSDLHGIVSITGYLKPSFWAWFMGLAHGSGPMFWAWLCQQQWVRFCCWSKLRRSGHCWFWRKKGLLFITYSFLPVIMVLINNESIVSTNLGIFTHLSSRKMLVVLGRCSAPGVPPQSLLVSSFMFALGPSAYLISHTSWRS